MLVEHDVEAELVGELPLVVIAMEQIGGDARIAFAVGQIDAQRAGMIVPGRVIGLLGELEDFHGAVSPRYADVVSLAVARRPALVGESLRLLLMREMPGALDHSKRAPGIIAQ